VSDIPSPQPAQTEPNQGRQEHLAYRARNEGILVSPSVFGFDVDLNLANQLAEIGIMLLMFGVGLHFSLTAECPISHPHSQLKPNPIKADKSIWHIAPGTTSPFDLQKIRQGEMKSHETSAA